MRLGSLADGSTRRCLLIDPKKTQRLSPAPTTSTSTSIVIINNINSGRLYVQLGVPSAGPPLEAGAVEVRPAADARLGNGAVRAGGAE